MGKQKLQLLSSQLNISNLVSFLYPMQRHVYGYQEKNIQIFADDSSLAVNPFYIKSWLELLSKTPRVAPFLSKNDPFILALKKVYTTPSYVVSLFGCIDVLKTYSCMSI